MSPIACGCGQTVRSRSSQILTPPCSAKNPGTPNGRGELALSQGPLAHRRMSSFEAHRVATIGESVAYALCQPAGVLPPTPNKYWESSSPILMSTLRTSATSDSFTVSATSNSARMADSSSCPIATTGLAIGSLMSFPLALCSRVARHSRSWTKCKSAPESDECGISHARSPMFKVGPREPVSTGSFTRPGTCHRFRAILTAHSVLACQASQRLESDPGDVIAELARSIHCRVRSGIRRRATRLYSSNRRQVSGT